MDVFHLMSSERQILKAKRRFKITSSKKYTWAQHRTIKRRTEMTPKGRECDEPLWSGNAVTDTKMMSQRNVKLL